jgi:hypothetical protein
VRSQLLDGAVGIRAPRSVPATNFDAGQRRPTVRLRFAPGSRWAHPDAPRDHPVHDARVKRLRHLNVFPHECGPEVRVPTVRLPDRKVAPVKPDWLGRLSGLACCPRRRRRCLPGRCRLQELRAFALGPSSAGAPLAPAMVNGPRSAQTGRCLVKHFDGIVAASGLVGTANGRFQAAKRTARRYPRFPTTRTVFFRIAANLRSAAISSHAAQPAEDST